MVLPSAPRLKSRYLFFATWPVEEGTGVNNVICGLSRAMRETGFEPAIVVTGWQQPVRSEQIWIKLYTPMPPLRNLLGFSFSFLPNLVKVWRVTRGAVAVNPHYFGPEVLPVVLLRKLRLGPKVILSAHGADVTEALKGNALSRKLYAWLCRNADAVVACSGALAMQVAQISPDARILPIWNGVSEPPALFGPRPVNGPYIVSIAAFVKKKGHDVLLQAFRAVAHRFPDLKLVLAGGDGPQHQPVLELARQLGLAERVELLVNVPHSDVWRYLHYAECFVHAAREEPFGIALLEAGLAGTPVVTTAVGGIKEYFIDGVHGAAVESDRPEKLAKALLNALTDRAQSHARALAFQQRARTFTWQAAWEQYRSAAQLE